MGFIPPPPSGGAQAFPIHIFDGDEYVQPYNTQEEYVDMLHVHPGGNFAVSAGASVAAL